MSTLKQKVKTLDAAEAAVLKELQRLYPEGSNVRVWLMHGQVNPSRGQVIGHTGGRHAYVLVRLRSRTEEVRTVAASSIVSCSRSGDKGQQ